MMTYLLMKLREQKAATAVEYALVVALIALAIIIALTALGTSLSDLFNRIVTTLSGV